MVNTLKIEPFSTEGNILEAAKKVFIITWIRWHQHAADCK